MVEYKPYTYLIGWTKHNKWYYGCEFSNNRIKVAHPSNLWTVYFTSSNYVKECRRTYGEPDVVLIRKIFSCAECALRWEEKVLRKMNVLKDDRWLNQSVGGEKFRIPKGVDFTEEHRRKLSENNVGFRGRRHTLESRKKIGKTLRARGHYHTKKTRLKISKSKIGYNPWEKFKHPRLGVTLTEDTAKKISESVRKYAKENPTIWITNGENSKRIGVNEEIPNGYRRGRK